MSYTGIVIRKLDTILNEIRELRKDIKRVENKL